MAIHHTQIKKAKDLGFELSENEGLVMTNSVPMLVSRGAKDMMALLDLNKVLIAEYPKLRVTLRPVAKGHSYVLVHADDWNFVQGDLGESVPDLGDVLEVADDLELDLGENLEEDEEPGHTVVGSKYKAIYAERGTPNHCGDWLARWLVARFNEDTKVEVTGKSGKVGLRKRKVFNLDRFTALLENNGISISGAWATNRSKGWQGRFRMNGRQLLEIAIVKSGVFVDDEGAEVDVDQSWLANMQLKHHKHTTQEEG